VRRKFNLGRLSNKIMKAGDDQSEKERKKEREREREINK
jgi:hypothetical protein